MFDLQGYILSRSWSSRSAADILADLTNSAPTVVDDRRYTWSGIAQVIGSQATEGLKAALTANGLTWVVQQLTSEGDFLPHSEGEAALGLPLYHADVQAVLTQLATAGVPGCQTLKDHVIKQRSLWNSLTPDDAPTLSAVETALAGAVVAKAKLDALAVGKAAMLSRWDVFEAAISSWDVGAGEAPEY